MSRFYLKRMNKKDITNRLILVFLNKKVGFRLNNDVSADIIYHTLTCIQRKTCVQDVLVEVLKVDSPNNDGAFSDCVYILANGTNQQVKEWVQPLHPKKSYTRISARDTH